MQQLKLALVSLVALSGFVALGGNANAQPSYNWVPSSTGNATPPGAFVGGQETGRNLIVCRAAFKGGVHPGKLVAGKCNIGYGGAEHTVNRYEVLTTNRGARLDWKVSNGNVPKRAIRGGQETGRKLFVCRANHKRGVHPGKVVAGQCNIGYGGRELQKKRFEVLIEKRPAPVKLPHVHWVKKGKTMPQSAFVGGSEAGRRLVVCRAPHAGGVHPGKVVAGNCNIGYGGRELQKKRFEVLIATPRTVKWGAPGSRGRVVAGGQEPGRKLAICLAKHNGGAHPGKVVAGNCNIGWGGKEVVIPRYKVLFHGK